MTTLPVARVIAKNLRNNSINNFSFPEDIGAHGMLFMFREYTYSSSKQLSGDINGRLTDTVILPLPQNIIDRLTLRVERFEQGVLGEAISRSVEAAGTGVNDQGIMGGINNIRRAIANLAPTGTDLGNMVNASLGGDLPSDTISKLSFLARSTIDRMGAARNIDAGLGTTINPKAALYFDGVQMKLHSFDWNFMPRTRSESDVLTNIFNMFRRHSLPTYIDVISEGSAGRVLQRAMFKYPSIVEIKLLGIDENHFMSFKPCMIQQVDFNFSPNGQAILKGGKPAAVNVNISVIETDIWTSHDYTGDPAKQEVDKNLKPQSSGGTPPSAIGVGPR